MTETGWDVLVGRDDLARTAYVERPAPSIGPGEALLRPDRVGVTANNVTYALVGESMRYWDFFPADDGWGRVPLWGFADVAESNVDGVAVGTRVYGYLPPSSDLVVRPDRVDAIGFRDASAHRASLPSPYNIYATTTGDPSYDEHREDLQVLFRPLFITSFMLADFLDDHALFGAGTAVISSASSKTAYGTAFCLGLLDRRPRLVGLTSAGNVGFTRSLGCYDEVITYDDVTSLPADSTTAYVDIAGSIPLRRAVHEHLGASLVHDAVVGATHLDAPPQSGGDVPGPRPTFFFAPDQIRKRRADWGPGGIEARYGAAWRAFVPSVEQWVDVLESSGAEGLRSAWLEVLAGRVDPRRGHVIAL
ncbi:MAG TPA: DUF2855 family protein [Mycobacteriales bacterium]|nr:DUF2855 family protein [Mycobacteriales bacterium]